MGRRSTRHHVPACGWGVDRREAGFTLLELLTVMGVLGILAGVGIGFLGKSNNSVTITWSFLRDKIRTAHEVARQSGRPVRVEYIPDQEGFHKLRSKVLQTVGQWHLESGERPFAGLVPTLSGIENPDGRFGACMVPDPEQDASMFALSTGGLSRFQLIDGFAFQVELYLEARAKCIVATLDTGNTFELSLDDDLRPKATLNLAAPGGARGRGVEIFAQDEALPLRQWVSLEVYHDGRDFGIAVDGVVVAKTSAIGEPYQNRQDTGLFEVSPRGGQVEGRIDEIQLLGYDRGDDSELPPDVDIKGLKNPVVFDGRGRLTAPVTIEVSMEGLTERRTVAPGGVLK